MSKLIQCKDCGHQISKNAASCPNCGAKPKRTSIITWLALIFIGIPVLMAVFSNSSNDEISTPTETESTSMSLADTESNETTVPEPASNWDYEESKDEMRGSVSYFAQSSSINNIRLDFPYEGGTSLFLIVRNTPDNVNEVLFSTNNGQLWCEYNNCYMSAKFDNGEVKRYPLARAAAGSSETMFLDGSIEAFIQDLKKSNTAMLEIGFFNYGNQQFEFETSGLEWPH